MTLTKFVAYANGTQAEEEQPLPFALVEGDAITIVDRGNPIELK